MPDVSHDFGAHLRQAREQRGVSLRQIAERTKISTLALEALERNDISRLPGGIFTRAFVRSYAREVGLDPEDTVRRFVARFPDASAEETPRAFVGNPEHIEVDEAPTFGRAWRALAWSLPLLLGVGYFGLGGHLPKWGGASPQPAGTKAAEAQHPAVPPPPPPSPSAPVQALQPDAATAASLAGGTAANAVGAQGGAVPDVSQPVVGVAQAANTPSTNTPAEQPRPAAPVQVPAAAPPAAQPGQFRVTLAAREACWVSVRMDGASVFSALLRAGERKELVLRGQVSLTVGNAGALDFLVNDQKGRSLGGPGQVVTARLNAENLQTFIETR